MPRDATPSAFLRAIAEAYAHHGRDPLPALRRAQIDPALLNDDTARVSARTLETFAGLAMRELDDEALGWFSRRLPWGSYGLLARASLTAPDFGVAAKRWLRHHQILTDDLETAVAVDGPRAALVLRERRTPGDTPLMREFCLLTVLRNALGVCCWLVDAQVPLQRVCFPFPAPAHAEAYPLLFGCPVEFAAADTRAEFAAAHLSLSVRRDEAAMRRMLADALPLIVLRYRPERVLVQRARAALAADPAHASAETVAAALNVSPRTLHRHLALAGTTFQTLKDEARQTLAEGLLRRSAKPVKQVAAATGFGNEKSFARAFKTWTGHTPAAFRASGRA